jgi:nicotinamidase-related amidase
MQTFTLERESTGLLVIDVQEKLFPKIECWEEIFGSLTQLISGFQILNLPIVVSEQYPEGLGKTLPQITHLLGNPAVLTKTTFSCVRDEAFKQQLMSLPVSQWVVAGIEAHVCVLQTARDLINLGKNVVAVNNAMGSRSIYDFSSAIAELRDSGARVSSTETVLFELVRDSKAPEFKQISRLVQCAKCTC